MIEIIPTEDDIKAVQEYTDGKATEYTGMTYAQGLQAMLDWLMGNGDRPDLEG
jgi:hypothetical protein